MQLPPGFIINPRENDYNWVYLKGWDKVEKTILGFIQANSKPTRPVGRPRKVQRVDTTTNDDNNLLRLQQIQNIYNPKTT